MPWMETCSMKEKMRFVMARERGVYGMSELCERYGISRKTGYKWMNRFNQEGLEGLEDRSRRPHRMIATVHVGKTGQRHVTGDTFGAFFRQIVRMVVMGFRIIHFLLVAWSTSLIRFLFILEAIAPTGGMAEQTSKVARLSTGTHHPCCIGIIFT